MGTMIDTTGGALDGLLSALGSNFPDTIASYVTGSGGIEATPQQFASLVGKTGVFRYDQSPALLEFAAGNADGADIESGAGTVVSAVDAAKARENHGWYSWFYVSDANLADARTAAIDGKLSKVRFIVANWNLSQAEAEQFIASNPDVDAVQWASPTSNPRTICPGTSKTLAQLNVDLNVTRAGWFVKQSVTKPPVVPQKGIVVPETLVPMAVTSTDGKVWTA